MNACQRCGSPQSDEEVPPSGHKVAEAIKRAAFTSRQRRETPAEWADRMRAKGRKVPDSLIPAAVIVVIGEVVEEMETYRYPGPTDDPEAARFADGFEAGVDHFALKLRAVLRRGGL